MAWTAAVKSAAMQPTGQVMIVFTFARDEPKLFFDEPYFLSSPGDGFIENYAKQRVTNLQALDDFVADIVIGEITIKPDPTPTEADIFFAKYVELKGKEIALEKGLIKADDAALLALREEVKELFKDEYTKDFRWGG